MSVWLQSFRNTRDSDIERFIHTKAVSFEERKWSATYLLVVPNDTLEKMRIEAYFTLSNRVFTIDDAVSNRIRSKLSGGIKDMKHVHMILIGQLGKFYVDKEDQSGLHMNDILAPALSLIRSVDKLIPCRYALVECAVDRIGLVETYINCGFRPIQTSDHFVE